MRHLMKLSSRALARASQLERGGEEPWKVALIHQHLGKGDAAPETEPFHVKQGNAKAVYQNGRKQGSLL